MSREIQKWYAHIDLDAFFASVEQLDHPEYKGKPVIVGGRPEDRRGVVSTASYEARKYGVHSAMPTYQAYKLCPQGIFVHGNMKRYSELSYQIMSIFKDYSPEVDQMSIDEAFIDLTGTENLFGPPEETVKKIKERVKKETGLTVSVGLANTKYIAKIASGYKKPDGLFVVKPGTESEFMLNLPLNKVWGVGEKTLQSLNQKGIFTTKDIYEKDLDMLEFLFGKNTAAFLYDVVRGGHNETFRKETKNHSLSEERTFPYDITDPYTIETKILELAQDVMFRLLKEKGFSRTPFIKLRYGDFTTVSIQKTLQQNVISVDSFYEELIELFRSKWEKGRGIRLIGVGFEKIETEDKPFQQSLFEDSNQKKHKVEEAILKLSQKHPEIKVQKARTLKNIAVSFILGALLLNSASLKAQNKIQNEGAGTLLSTNTIPQEQDEDSETIFNFNINDSDKVEFQLSGYWLVDFVSGFNSSFGNNTRFGFSSTLPVFKQEVELSSWIMLNNQWYFQAEFADAFEFNTFTAGYKNGGYLNSAKISNRNIGFENDYSSNYFGYGLKAGKNQAPGISFQLKDIKNNKWSGDVLLRYDMTESKTATFYGLNSINDTDIEITAFEYGKKFIIPEAAVSELLTIKDIYVEHKNGKYKDKNNKTYEKLSPDQFAVYKNSLEFSKETKTYRYNNKTPAILITFQNESSVTKIINDTGDYDNPESYAGKIQSYFNSHNEKNIKLKDFSFNLENEINNEKSLVIQNSYGFSPYLCANLYNCGIVSDPDIKVISKTTEKASSEYTIYAYEDGTSIFDSSYQNKFFYGILANLESDNNDFQNPENRYPLGAYNPQVYLNLQSDIDDVIRIRTYTALSALQIGTKASEGTVVVYKNGVIDAGASYNPETGIVTLSSPPSSTDKIVIQYQEDSPDNGGGAFVSGLGFIYNFNPEFKLDLSITNRWPFINHHPYATQENPSNGFSAITAGASYNKNSFELSDKLSLAVVNPNTTGKLLVNSTSENISETTYQASSGAKITKTEPVINNVKLLQDKNGNCEEPKGIKDPYISGYGLPLKWNFTDFQDKSECWAGIDVVLTSGNEFSKASYIEFALKPNLPENINTSDIKVYLQLGIDAENMETVPSYTLPLWEITNFAEAKVINSLDLSSNIWQTVRIQLEDSDRSKLTSSYDCRLLVVKNSHSEEGLTGSIILGPYEPSIQNIFTKQNSNILVRTSSELTNSSPAGLKYKSLKNYSTKLSWNITDSSSIALTKDSEIKAVNYFDAADFNSYKNLTLDFAYIKSKTSDTAISDTKPAFTLVLDTEATDIDSEGKVALKLELNSLDDFISENLIFHSLTVSLNTKEVFIDDTKLDSNQYSLFINNKIIPNRQKLIINTIQKDSLVTKGDFYINNLYYSDSESYFNSQNFVSVSYEKQGSIIKVHDYDLLKDFSVELSGLQGFISDSTFTAETGLNTSVTFADIQTNYDILTGYNSQDKNNFHIKNAGHSVKTLSPIVSVINFSEDYRYDLDSISLTKANSSELNFTKLNFPLNLEFKSEGKSTLYNQQQNFSAIEKFNYEFKKIKLNLDSSFSATQRINSTTAQYAEDSTNYFKNWLDISKLEFSTGDTKATNRNIALSINSGLNIKEIELNPNISYNQNYIYSNAKESKGNSIQNLSLVLPFKINKNSFSINYSRLSATLKDVSTGGNYNSDIKELYSDISNSEYFYTSIPFAELFINNDFYVSKFKPAYLSQGYSSKYEINWKHPLSNSKKDLFIPSSTNLSLERNIIATATLSDLYQLKLNVNNNSINNFGSKSLKPVYTWFESDEIASSITGIIKIPAKNHEKIIYEVSAYEQLLIYINNKASIKTAMDFQLSSDNLWSVKATGIYSRPTQDSLILELINWMVPKSKKVTFEIIQKETVNISTEKNSEQYSTMFDYLHNTNLKFLKNFSLDFGIGGNLILNSKKASSLGITIEAGGKMEF